jgi:hypothetical protein
MDVEALAATNYLDGVAVQIRDRLQPELIPDDGASLLRIYAVLALLGGTQVTEADVHNAWVAWMLGRDQSHEALVPFDQLDPEVAAADRPFAEAVRTVASELRLRETKGG